MRLPAVRNLGRRIFTRQNLWALVLCLVVILSFVIYGMYLSYTRLSGQIRPEG